MWTTRYHLLKSQSEIVAVVQHATDVHVAYLEPVLPLADATGTVSRKTAGVHLTRLEQDSEAQLVCL